MTPINARELEQAIMIDLDTGLVPFIKGSPGIGKSAMMRSIARKGNLKLIIVHGSILEPTDINGFPDIGGKYARFKTFEMFPLEGEPLPINPETGEPYAGWLLFLDEINSASTETQAALYAVVLDKKVGQEKLHPSCYIVAAGNLRSDNAIVNTQSSAMTSRMVNYEMKLVESIFLEDVVAPQNWHFMVAAYLEWKPENLHRFDPKKAEDPYPCPRTWDMLQARMTAQDDYEWENSRGHIQKGFNYEATHNRASAEGLIGQEIGRDFITFCRVFGQIPTTKAIINDPLGIALPDSRGLQFALVVQLRKEVEVHTLDEVYQFVERLDPEFRVTFLRGVLSDTTKQIPRSHPTIIHAQKNLRKRP